MLRTRIVHVAILFFFTPLPLLAQFRGGIQGTITDPSGGVVGGVAITCTSSETKRQITETADSSGVYHCLQLAPGIYSVQATLKGFKVTDLTVTVNAEAIETADIALQPGQVSQEVTVSAETSPAIETSNGDVTRALTTQEVLALPQVGRDPYELLRLTPGIFGDAARSGTGQSVAFPNESASKQGSNVSLFQTENETPISADGQRITSNNYMIDGVSVNSLEWGGAAVVTPTQESVKEIRVNANAYSAEYGRNTGAQINTITQNGTNQFHGSGVFLMQDPNFNAYNKPSIPTIPVTRVDNNFRNYAASLGGPVVKNHLFFFFSFEGVHENTVSYAQDYVETPQFDQAILSLRPNTLAAKVIGTTGNAPRVVSVLPLNSCPTGLLPNCQVVHGQLDLGSIGGAPGTYFAQNSAGAGLDGIPDVEYANVAQPQQYMGQQYNGRIDWSRNNDYLAGSSYVTYLKNTGADASADARPNADTHTEPTNADVTLIYTRIISPTLINEARGNFTRFAFNQILTSGLTDYGIPALQVQFQGLPQIQYGASQADTNPANFAQNTYEFRDSVSKVAGNHALKLGFELRREQDNTNYAGAARPVYAIQNLWNFANDAPAYEGIEANPLTGGAPSTQEYFRSGGYALFLQDDWKVTPRLTVNLGLRWEYFNPLSEKTGNLYNWLPGPGYGNLAQSTIQKVPQVFNGNSHDVGPRFGFAYNPISSFVVRGGFGMMFNRPEDALLEELRQDSPYSESFGLCCGSATSPFASGQIRYELGASNTYNSYAANPALATGINTATGTPNLPAGQTISVYSVPTHFPIAYAYIYSLETDFNFKKDYVFTLGYQGSDDHHLLHIVDQNFLYTPPANSPFGAIYNVQPDVNSNYNALNATLSRRLSKGVQFQQNFRWAKSLDTNSFDGPGADTNPTYPQNLQSEYGPSDFDVKYTSTASGLYEVPFFRDQKGLLGKVLGGWRINTIFTFHTGFPWTAKTGQAEETPTGVSLSPTRPYEFLCGSGHPCPLTGQSNSAFLRPNGNFPGGGAEYFLYTYPTGFTTLPPGIGRNTFRGPWYKDVDFSVDKVVKLQNPWLGETTQLDLRLNLFNAFNQQNFAPFNFYDNSTFVDQPALFGMPTSELAGRNVELQARFSF